jgi:formylglycine-generating enzyme required for sulfatase activity
MGSSDAAIAALLALDPPGFVRAEFPSEQPEHEVRITRGFWIDIYEVTMAAFQAFADAGGYQDQRFWSEDGWAWLVGQDASRLPRPCSSYSPEHPRVCVTWYEAEAYAAWRGGRLPTEAEWEYAARGPRSSLYPWGDEWDAARCNILASLGPVPAGSFPAGASWIGAEDMAGNAMEWVQDWLDVEYYQQGAAVDPIGPPSGRVKVEKGGWWGSNPFVARSAYRHFEDPPSYQDAHIGFRVVTP